MNRSATLLGAAIAIAMALCAFPGKTGARAGTTRTGSYLVVADFGGDKVLRYDGGSGAFIDTLVPKNTGGMNQPYGVLFGPHDGDLFVSTGQFGGPGQLKAVLRFDSATGAFVEEFTKGGDLKSPRGIIFGPVGDLYVATGTGGFGGKVARFDGITGEFLGDFVTPASGGLRAPGGSYSVRPVATRKG